MNNKSSVLACALLLSVGGFFSPNVLAGNTAKINIKGNLIVNSPCDITSTGGSDTISVDFGDIVIRKMETQAANTAATTAMYQTALPIKLTCDAPNDTAVRIGLRGSVAPFNSEFLGTNNPNVGIQFINLGKGTFIPNDTGARRARVFVGTSFTFYVVPIRNVNVATTAVTAGAFTTTATLVADYE